MPETIEVQQTAAIGSHSTQVAVQYVGIPADQVAKQMVDIFLENFPKLQKIAKETAEQRVTELCSGIMNKLEERHIINFQPFAEPDVQYVLLEAQKNYARFGEIESMKVLTELVTHRIQSNDKGHFKRIMDSAILVASELSAKQLDCLSILFMLTRVKFSSVKTVEDLAAILKRIDKAFNLINIDYTKEIEYLSYKGCLQLCLPDISEALATGHKLSIDDVKKILPKEAEKFSTDYGITEIGIALAIANAEQKIHNGFDPHIWIAD